MIAQTRSRLKLVALLALLAAPFLFSIGLHAWHTAYPPLAANMMGTAGKNKGQWIWPEAGWVAPPVYENHHSPKPASSNHWFLLYHGTQCPEPARFLLRQVPQIWSHTQSPRLRSGLLAAYGTVPPCTGVPSRMAWPLWHLIAHPAQTIATQLAPGYYVADPKGRLILYYPLKNNPIETGKAVVSDIKVLFKHATVSLKEG